jgi:cytochrome c peroxidase
MNDFEKVFGTRQVDIDKVTRAIAAFEETLVTPNSRFDKWLLGNDAALTATEIEGYHLFRSSGCTVCHNGPAAGGTSFRKMGLVEPYRTDNPAEGRVAVTGLTRSVQLQGADDAQRGVDVSLLPRRCGGDAGRGG